ncbi:hypothetical protein JEQ12_013397 [Ovis aries]|uniref:Uncharacterized protein n=1 Tax=Ovis aries TaxID=9940 RepID=A0A836D353_SHEEP|nr:hypothetical protein JEQ12_013397 [Ovis aries]
MAVLGAAPRGGTASEQDTGINRKGLKGHPQDQNHRAKGSVASSRTPPRPEARRPSSRRRGCCWPCATEQTQNPLPGTDSFLQLPRPTAVKFRRVNEKQACGEVEGPVNGLDESEEDEEEPDFAVHSSLPPLHSNRNLVLSNGPALCPATAFSQRSPPARALCRSCSRSEPPAFFLQEPEDEGVSNGGERVAYRSISQEDVGPPPGGFGGLQALNPNRLSAMREAFSRSRSVSTDV